MIEPVLEAYRKSWQRMTTLLFSPFQIQTYLMFVLIFFLAECGSIGAQSNQIDLGSFPDQPTEIEPLAVGIMVVVAVAVLLGVVMGMALLAGALFVSSRATMMAIDGLRQGAPRWDAWTLHARAANALWRFRVAVMVAGVGWVALVIGGAVVAALVLPYAVSSIEVVKLGKLGMMGVLLLAVLGPLILSSLVDWLAKDLAAPILMVTDTTVVGAFRLLWGAARFEPATLFVYVALRVALALVVGMVSFPFMLIFCCFFLIPGVRHAALLPVLVFQRGLSVYWLATLDDRLAPLVPLDSELAA